MGNRTRLLSIRKKRDFESLRSDGTVIHVTHWLMVVCRPNDSEKCRVGWTLPKFVGPAVVRNRLRRWGRERVRVWDFDQWSESLDFNFVFKKKAADFYKNLSREDFGTAFIRAFEKVRRKYEILS
ncbi:MAG: ribonuclease P protein component [Bdellovibrionales bacterium]|nr:ribonuclease P protein component [Bdellovibrionales bacterium]